MCIGDWYPRGSYKASAVGSIPTIHIDLEIIINF